jgi:hypothetical protein
MGSYAGQIAHQIDDDKDVVYVAGHGALSIVPVAARAAVQGAHYAVTVTSMDTSDQLHPGTVVALCVSEEEALIALARLYLASEHCGYCGKPINDGMIVLPANSDLRDVFHFDCCATAD